MKARGPVTKPSWLGGQLLVIILVALQVKLFHAFVEHPWTVNGSDLAWLEGLLVLADRRPSFVMRGLMTQC